VSCLSIVIADDHSLVRAGFSALLRQIPGVQVVAEARDGSEAWELIVALQPALALVDISMPLLNGLELTARVAAQQPSTRVIMLSMYATEDYVHRAFKAGAAGYLLKDSSPNDLETAIRAVTRGETVFNIPGGLDRARSASVRPQESIRSDSLTPRQREILQLIGEGHSTKEIAGLLGISVKTAESHRTQLMERLDLHDVAAVVRFGVAAGLVNPQS
jgi:DNA-binding NarL/FixJ family response regulator